MDSFVIRPMTWPGLRVMSRNPLVRASDRVESVVIMLAAVAVLVAAAGMGAVGTMVYSAQAQMYAQQAQTRHAVMATAVENSKTVATPQTMVTTVYARWQLNGADAAAELTWNGPVTAGERLPIWVDDQGNRVTRPALASRAAAEAITVAVIGWLSVVLAVVHGASTVRIRANRMRDAQWDHDISCLVDDDGGYTNRMQ